MILYRLERQQRIDAPLPDVFAFFGKPEHLAELTPRALGLRILTPGPVAMKEGALIDYTIRLFGVPIRWTTLITDFRPPHRFVDVQLRGPYAYWHHTHTFTETDDGTLMSDEVQYALPLGFLGRWMHRLVVRRQLERIFQYRRDAIASLSGSWRSAPADAVRRLAASGQSYPSMGE